LEEALNLSSDRILNERMSNTDNEETLKQEYTQEISLVQNILTCTYVHLWPHVDNVCSPSNVTYDSTTSSLVPHSSRYIIVQYAYSIPDSASEWL
jgi:hypothetical protein